MIGRRNPASPPSPSVMDSERCDRCGKRAFVMTAMTVVPGLELTLSWCAHHYSVFEPGLAASGARVAADERSRLQTQEAFRA